MRFTRLASFVAGLSLVFAQNSSSPANSTETIWGVITINMFGDRIPILSPLESVLTPVGAEQMASAGTFFRERYIDGTNGTAINGINANQLDVTQLFISAPSVAFFIQQSAQAFASGLYPPLGSLPNSTFSDEGGSTANGPTILGPFNGYQFPQYYLASTNDPMSVLLDGSTGCTNHEIALTNLQNSAAFGQVLQSSQSFYDALITYINGTTSVGLNYLNAYLIWDFLQYQAEHDTAFADSLSNATLMQAQYLADELVFSQNGNTSNTAITVAGGTLAYEIAALVDAVLNSFGTEYKFNALFTSFEPMVALAALLGLPAVDSNFYGLPQPGSSMVFEIFSMDSSIPTAGNVNIRFLFKNGSQPLTTYDMFGSGNSSMTFGSFMTQMGTIALDGPGAWCSVCNSTATLFCPFYEGTSAATTPSTSAGLHPWLAGLIGALVALAVAFIVLALVMLGTGLRFRKTGSSVLVKPFGRRSSGGFKGSNKLPSDLDLPKSGGLVATAAVTDDHDNTHRRMESWELKEAGISRSNMRMNDDTDLHHDMFHGVPVKEHSVL